MKKPKPQTTKINSPAKPGPTRVAKPSGKDRKGSN